jgi:hypothetical protein
VQPRVVAVQGQQLGVRAALDDAALVHHQDDVGALDGGQAVGDHQRGAAAHDAVERGLDVALGFGVERRGGFVEDEDRRVLQQRPGDGQALALAAGEQHAVLADQGVEALRQPVDELAGEGRLGGALDVGARRAGEVAVGDVAGHRVVEQRHLLGDDGDVAAQVAQGVVLDIRAVDEDLPLLVVIEARDQVGQGGLAAARAADQRHHLPRLDGEADAVEHAPLAAGIGEGQVAHLEPAADALAAHRAGVGFRRLVELLEDALGRRHALLDGRADFGELADRLGQQPGRGDVGHQFAGEASPRSHSTRKNSTPMAL